MKNNPSAREWASTHLLKEILRNCDGRAQLLKVFETRTHRHAVGDQLVKRDSLANLLVDQRTRSQIALTRGEMLAHRRLERAMKIAIRLGGCRSCPQLLMKKLDVPGNPTSAN
jgi:hypothetical protein